ncbi:hypothetical protein EMIHUDRAFT_215699 [Emiliania huxleyi CCMP1516]|uniref:Calcineurin-like phosphoesterase domain-containing protein n=2 Tax=Emiliania huxleyi TaxID=2903 RepID=A0A0D3IGT9_EMIH1|nr:hypothetical protein EMIHUDRAFT_215699 [Emiliania huxleyi CCMP1516]EOD10474.1 hypothetical protein EMIHUDRAFT_215699 [Emiliania huxleyi CCMP1516]|eukprot:XP_005762903.1 hypothetical protein EMIHUDRAFT_215699 [Emiliania huxleyi CCMP1516]
MAATTRFLVAGDTGGDLARLFARVGAVNAKHGPFAFLLCVGDFLGAADASAAALAPYLSGDAAVPLPTYVLASRPGEPDPALAAAGPGGELAPQLFYLGSAGVAELSGLRAKHSPTNYWDTNAVWVDAGREVGLEEVAELAVKLRPRYHFCGGEGAFWQRPPYRLDARSHACRMVGLSRVQEDKKQTWLKAFGMAALGGAVPAQPEGTTDCPYPYAALTAGGGGGGGERRGERAAKRLREEWAQLDRRAVLVTSVGDEAYLTIAKGILMND